MKKSISFLLLSFTWNFAVLMAQPSGYYKVYDVNNYYKPDKPSRNTTPAETVHNSSTPSPVSPAAPVHQYTDEERRKIDADYKYWEGGGYDAERAAANKKLDDQRLLDADSVFNIFNISGDLWFNYPETYKGTFRMDKNKKLLRDGYGACYSSWESDAGGKKIYVGNWHADKKSGHAKVYNTKGEVLLEGIWRNGDYCDTGCYGNCKDYTFDGSKLDNSTYTWSNGNQWVGSFKNGLPNGKGTLYYGFNNDSEFDGYAVNGRLEGEGNLLDSNHFYIRSGYWKNDTFQVGCVSGDCQNGTGIYQFINSNQWRGGFKDGLPNGPGTFHRLFGAPANWEIKQGKNGELTIKTDDGKYHTTFEKLGK
jgi:hypothetical protein